MTKAQDIAQVAAERRAKHFALAAGKLGTGPSGGWQPWLNAHYGPMCAAHVKSLRDSGYRFGV